MRQIKFVKEPETPGEIFSMLDAIKTVIMLSMDWEPSKSLAWMVTRNPFLGGTSPVMMVFNGRTKKLVDFVNSSLSENLAESGQDSET